MSSIHPEKPFRTTVVRELVVLALALAAAAVLTLIVLGAGGSSGRRGTASPVRPSDHPKDRYYVVRAGDSFSTIAAKEAIGQALIRRLNPSLDPLSIQPRNCVDLVPHGCRKLAASHAGSSAAPSSSAPKAPYYVVRLGDSLSAIAGNEGVDLARIEHLNPNLHPDNIQPGDCVDLVPSGCSERSASGQRSRELGLRQLPPGG